jgi:hypothetical protein
VVHERGAFHLSLKSYKFDFKNWKYFGVHKTMLKQNYDGWSTLLLWIHLYRTNLRNNVKVLHYLTFEKPI